MLTEPVGPRSPDEILASVYERTHRTRRRRRTRMGAGGALMAVAMTAGLLALRPAGEEARLRVVDRNPDAKEAATTRTPAAADDHQVVVAAATPTTTVSRTDRSKKAPPAAGGGGGPLAAQPPAITTTTTTTLPPVRLLAEAADEQNDATPNDWSYDVVYGSMHLDAARGGLRFTTSYRSPGGSAESDRPDRIMSTRVTYDQTIYDISVDEIDGRLSKVKIDGHECDTCEVAFGSATLTVDVPVEAFNAAVLARDSEGRLLNSQSQIEDLEVATAQVIADLDPVPADSSRDSGGV